ncbi:hypothetical protein FACS1894170_10690 [Planctomycetales bacterium]|nr:hypothetical protein FACS1894170_10690 [Planctomycetales bacterium]
MSNKLQVVLYVCSIVVAVGIGMIQHKNALEFNMAKGAAGCVQVMSDNCVLLGGGCTGPFTKIQGNGNLNCAILSGNQCDGGNACQFEVKNLNCVTESGCP